MNEYEWKEENSAIEPGWYAIHYCWEIEEGSFVGADLWTGTVWETTRPILDVAGPFATDTEAEKWAEANDCSW